MRIGYPVHTRFYPDGSYTSVYHDLRDNIVMTKTGDHATFSGLIDFNGDGKTDDR